MFWNRHRKFNILITGAKGQLGSFLVDMYRKLSYRENSCVGLVFGIDIDDLDLTDRTGVADFFLNQGVYNPPVKLDYVINCAAVVDTPGIERNPYKSYAANCLAPRNVATSCRFNGIKLIQISTDYVFSEYSGRGASRYEFPINQYGMQKLLAEQFVQSCYRDRPQDLMILRSSWMFGNSKKSFVEKFIRNVFRTYKAEITKSDPHIDTTEKIPVKVADDAFGKPTHVFFIAELILRLMQADFSGMCDCQPYGPQITRANWATQILNCLRSRIKGLREINEYYAEILTMLDSVEVQPCSSAELNLLERHPGKVYDHSNAGMFYSEKKGCGKKYAEIIDELTGRFGDLTEKYVSDNFSSLCELAHGV